MPNSDQRDKVLISAAGVKELLGNPALVILDIRFDPAGADRRDAYRTGHIPRAQFVDLGGELAGEPKGFSGRRPLPDLHDLQRDARRWGIRHDSIVVVYDDKSGLHAGRAWWTLTWAGIENVRLLDGGLAAWTQAGHPTTREIELPSPGDIVLAGGKLPVLDADQAASFPSKGILIDARALEQAASGHIPGALSAPTTGNLAGAGGFLTSDELRERFRVIGIDGSKPVGVYCGGGVAASHEIAALTSIGIEASLFPGSWSAWSSDPARPVAKGFDPA
jgi:thiosulfate/3-mercaptopyruvate sulfurtransferase